MNEIPTPDTLDRIAKILMDAGQVDSYAAAKLALASYAVRVCVSPEAAASAAGQAALVTIAITGARALPGGVFVEGEVNVPLQVGAYRGASLAEVLAWAGAKLSPGASVQQLPVINVGSTDQSASELVPTLSCFYAGWRGGVVPLGASIQILADARATECASVLAGAVAVSEVFQYFLGGNAQAGRRATGMSLWAPGRLNRWWEEDPSEPRVAFLPNGLWLIGLGHLGQAFLWVISLLPYAKPADLLLVLQDFDHLTPANCSTSVLTTPGLVKQSKTRAMASWAESRGFRTVITERKFAADFRVAAEEPTIALCGVDNSIARTALADVGFSFVVNAGLGAGPVNFLAMRCYTFPGPKSPRSIWGHAATRRQATRHGQPAYQALKAAGVDDCGLTLLAQRTVGAPFVGMTAAAMTIAEVLRALHGGERTLILDATLASLGHRQVVLGSSLALGNPGFTEVR